MLKHIHIPHSLALAAAITLGLATSTSAVAERKAVIAISGDDYTLEETDVSHLGVGESEIIETESGKVIEILREDTGFTIFVDGEMLPKPPEAPAMAMHISKEVVCDDTGECSEEVHVLKDGEELEGLDDLEGEHHKRIMIIEKEEIHEGEKI